MSNKKQLSIFSILMTEYGIKMERLIIFLLKHKCGIEIEEQYRNIIKDEYFLLLLEKINGDNDFLSNLYETVEMSKQSKTIKIFQQYFTDKKIVNYIYSIIQLNEENNVIDLCSGIGNLITKTKKFNINPKNIYAFEIDEDLYQMCFYNLKEYYKEDIKVYHQNSFYNDMEQIKQLKNKFIIINPPFNADYNDKKLNRYVNDDKQNFKTTDLMFLNMSLNLMNENDKLVIILPINILFKKNLEYIYLRKKIIKNYNLEYILTFFSKDDAKEESEKNKKKISKEDTQYFINTSVNVCVFIITKIQEKTETFYQKIKFNKNGQELIYNKKFTNEEMLKYINCWEYKHMKDNDINQLLSDKNTKKKNYIDYLTIKENVNLNEENLDCIYYNIFEDIDNNDFSLNIKSKNNKEIYIHSTYIKKDLLFYLFYYNKLNFDNISTIKYKKISNEYQDLIIDRIKWITNQMENIEDDDILFNQYKKTLSIILDSCIMF